MFSHSFLRWQDGHFYFAHSDSCSQTSIYKEKKTQDKENNKQKRTTEDV